MKCKITILSSILILLFGITLLYGQTKEQERTKTMPPKKLKEDLVGRANWWRQQRILPDSTLPDQARFRALVQKRLMEESAVSSDIRIERFEEDLKGRHEYWHSTRAYPLDEIPKGARLRAMGRKKEMTRITQEQGKNGGHNSPPVVGVCNWVSVGPRNINGRVRSLAIHPTNGAIIYAGAAEGGVWKSTNYGQSWVPLMQYADAIAVGSIAIDPTTPNTIYVGTGEPTWWPGYDGVGVLKSTDGGMTWNATGTLGNGHIARVAVDPTNTNRVYCAGFSGGLYRSTNGGTSWTLILAGDVTDFALNTTTTTTMYAGKRNDGVYESTNDGSTWTKLGGGLPATMSNRVMLSLCDANPQVVYAKLDQTVYKTTNGGTTWSNLGNHGGTTYGYWCTYIAVDPTDPNIVFAAGISVEKSTDGGATWTAITTGTNWEIDRLHPDQHALVYDPTDHTKIYAGNDGGVYYSTNSGNNWKKVSDGLIITQFYDVGISKATPSMMGGGTQDQGTNATVGGLTWEYLFNADGGFVVCHPTDSYIMYAETQYNGIRKSTDGGNSWTNATTGLTGSGPWIGAIVLDETSPNTLFTGRQEVFRTTNGAASWTASSPSVGGSVSALAIAPSNHLIVYAGTSAGNIWKSTDGGATLGNWTDMTTTPLPNRFLSDIVVHRTDPNTVYLTYSGFASSTPATPGHVFRSTDGGTTWADISGTSGSPTALPDIPTTAIELDMNSASTLYVGTDIGIFKTTNTGTDWGVFEAGFPHVAVPDLEINETNGYLIAATHGRGMWQFNVNSSPTCADVDIYVRDNYLDNGMAIPSPSHVDDPFSVIRGGSIGDQVTFWQSADIKVDALPYYTPDALFDGVEFDRDADHDKPVRTQVNKVYVQVHNRGPFNATNVTVKILWTNAAAGLPPLPGDFWTNYPNDPSVTTVWHPIGTYQTISVLEPTRPVVLTWNWTPPSTATTHSCILCVIDSPDDPIPAANKQFNVDWCTRNTKQITHKNLNLINASPGPLPLRGYDILFHNTDPEMLYYDIIIDRSHLPKGSKIYLTFDELRPRRLMKEMVEGIRFVEKRNWWMRELFVRNKPLFVVDSNKGGMIRRVPIKPEQKVKARFYITLSREAKPGQVYEFSIQQGFKGRIVGGNTYQVRVRQ